MKAYGSDSRVLVSCGRSSWKRTAIEKQVASFELVGKRDPPSIPLLHRLAFLLLSASLAARVLALLRVLMIAVFFEDIAVVAEPDDEDEEVWIGVECPLVV